VGFTLNTVMMNCSLRNIEGVALVVVVTDSGEDIGLFAGEADA
jgi:hypothetical protein